MQYLNLTVADLRSTEFRITDYAQRGIWLRLMEHCVDQENGGIIKGCRAWTPAQWHSVLQVERDSMLDDCSIWEWFGDDLVIRFYPSAQEETHKTRQSASRENGKRGGRPPKNPRNPPETQDKNLETCKGREGNEREWNGMEEEWNSQTQTQNPKPTDDEDVLLEKEPKAGPESLTTPKARRKSIVDQEANVADSTPLPLTLATPDFRKAWALWCQHRRELAHRDKRKPWTDTAARATLQQCAAAGPESGAAAIVRAVGAQWQGLHFDAPVRQANTNGNGNGHALFPDRQSILPPK